MKDGQPYILAHKSTIERVIKDGWGGSLIDALILEHIYYQQKWNRAVNLYECAKENWVPGNGSIKEAFYFMERHWPMSLEERLDLLVWCGYLYKFEDWVEDHTCYALTKKGWEVFE